MKRVINIPLGAFSLIEALISGFGKYGLLSLISLTLTRTSVTAVSSPSVADMNNCQWVLPFGGSRFKGWNKINRIKTQKKTN